MKIQQLQATRVSLGGGPADVADGTAVGGGALPEESEVGAGVELHSVVRIGGRDRAPAVAYEWRRGRFSFCEKFAF